MYSVYNEELNNQEIGVIAYLCEHKLFYGPQKELAASIGYSRPHTNIAIKLLEKKGLITLLKAKTFNRKLKLIALSAKAVSGLGTNE